MGKTHVITSVINITLSRDDLFEFANMLINADFKKAWLTAQEVTEVFGIPYANVKSAQWRKESKFPSHQPGDRPSYYFIKYSKTVAQKAVRPEMF